MTGKPENSPKSSATLYSVLLPMLLTLLPLLVIGYEANLRVEAKRAEINEQWFDHAQSIASNWKSASTYSYWIENFSAKLHRKLENAIGTHNYEEGNFTPTSIRELAHTALKESLPKGLPKPRIWLFTLPDSQNEMPRICSGRDFENTYSRLIGSIFHEIYISKSSLQKGKEYTSRKQTLERLFGFGVSPGLFEIQNRGNSFAAVFQGKSVICVWNLIYHDEMPIAAFLAMFPSTLDDAALARRLCFHNWHVLSNDKYTEPVFFPYPIPNSKTKKVILRHDSPLGHDAEIRAFLRTRAAQIKIKKPGKSGDRQDKYIDRWYLNRSLCNFISEVRLPEQEFGRIFEINSKYSACWATLDTLAGGIGLLIGRVSPLPPWLLMLSSALPIKIWASVWLLILLQFALFRRFPVFGIQAQLAFWFLCLSSIPLIIAVSETDKLLSDLQKNLLREYDQELSQALQELESENSALAVKFSEIARRRLGDKKLIEALSKAQTAGQPVEPILDKLWQNFENDDRLPIGTLILFGHGGLEWSRYNARVSPETINSFVEFLRPQAQEFLKRASPALSAKFPQKKPTKTGLKTSQIDFLDQRANALKRDNQLAEMIAGNQRLMKFHQILHLNGEVWFGIIILWEQSAAYVQHIQTQIFDIAKRHKVDLEITQTTPEGERSLTKSGPPIYRHIDFKPEFQQIRIISKSTPILPGCRLWAARSLAPLIAKLLEEKRLAIIKVTCNFLIILCSGSALSLWLITPLKGMSSTLLDVTAGQLNQKLRIRRDDELGMAAANIDAMIDWLRERHTMSLFVAPQVLESITGDSAGKKPKRRSLAVLVCDIRSFTTISESQPPQTVFQALNEHFSVMTPAIKNEGGAIDRFIGDAIQAVFYDEENSNEPASRKAIRAARIMMQNHKANQQKRAESGLFTYNIGIGIASGEAVCGVIGADKIRQDYSILGEVVKQAAELESASKVGRTSKIICSEKVVAESASPASFIPLSGYIGAFELADFEDGLETANLENYASISTGSSKNIFTYDTEKVLNLHIPKKRIAIALTLAAGITYSLSGSLTKAYHERFKAHATAELNQDIRLLESTADPTIHIANHIYRSIFDSQSNEKSIELDEKLIVNLRKLGRYYKNSAWCIIEHDPRADTNHTRITPKSSKIFAISGSPFQGNESEAIAMFSLLKASLTNGLISSRYSSQINSMACKWTNTGIDILNGKLYKNYARFEQWKLSGKSGYMIWFPITSPGWWGERERLINSSPTAEFRDSAWWMGLRACVFIFLPETDLNERNGFLAMASNIKARGTYLSCKKSPVQASSVSAQVQIQGRKHLTAFRYIPPSPAWMRALDKILLVISIVLATIALLIVLKPSMFTLFNFLPSRLEPLLAFVFVVTLFPSFLTGWLAGERRHIEQRARFFDEALQKLEKYLINFDGGIDCYRGCNINFLLYLTKKNQFFETVKKLISLPNDEGGVKATQIQSCLNNLQQETSNFSFINEAIIMCGPRDTSGILWSGETQHDRTLCKAFESLYIQTLRRFAPMLFQKNANTDANSEILEDWQAEELKHLFLVVLPVQDFAKLLAAIVTRQHLLMGINNFDLLRIYVPNDIPSVAFQFHLASRSWFFNQFRNFWEIRFQCKAPSTSVAMLGSYITSSFNTLSFVKKGPQNIDLNIISKSFPTLPDEILTDSLAAKSKSAIHSILGKGRDAAIFTSMLSSSQPTYLIRGRVGYGKDLAKIIAVAKIRHNALMFFLFFSVLVAIRTARRFLEPAAALSKAAQEIMQEHFEVRLADDRQDEFGALAKAFNKMAAGVEESRKLRMFVSDSVRSAAKNASHNKAACEGELREAAILFASPVEFNSILQERTPEAVIPLLNAYLQLSSNIIVQKGGEIDKFIGEKILAVFDAESHGTLEAAAKAAVNSAQEIAKCVYNLDKRGFAIAIGIVAGPVLGGIMGTPDVRLEYTVIGDTVNSAARLCDLAARIGGGIVIDAFTASSAPEKKMKALGEIPVKGKKQHIATFKLL